MLMLTPSYILHRETKLEQIFPQYMKDAGYETHMIGKWHIGSYTHHHIPSQRGFDTYLGYLNDEEMYWTHQVSASYSVIQLAIN